MPHSGTTDSQSTIRVVFPSIEQAATGRLIQGTFNHHPDTELVFVPNLFDPTTLPEHEGGNRDELLQDPQYFTHGIPPEWHTPPYRDFMRQRIKDGIKAVKDGDILGLTGGRDFNPALLGHLFMDKTQPFSKFDFRDVVGLYMLMTAIAEGKTVHATCRGYQVLMATMLAIFSDDDPDLRLRQDIPTFYTEHQLSQEHGIHHAGGALHEGVDELINRQNWHLQLLQEQLAGKEPSFAHVYPGCSHEIAVEGPGVLRDALLDVSKHATHSTVWGTEPWEVLRTKMVTLHHQGFVYLKEQYQRFKSIFSEMGGNVVALSNDPRDRFAAVIEGVTISLEIGEEQQKQIQKKLDELNELLGLDISLDMPKLAPGQTLRFDAPYANQSHGELNVAGIALKGPAYTVAFAQGKKQALAQGRDIGGYNGWRETIRQQALAEIDGPIDPDDFDWHEALTHEKLSQITHIEKEPSPHHLIGIARQRQSVAARPH